jgi:hypothetical protein
MNETFETMPNIIPKVKEELLNDFFIRAFERSDAIASPSCIPGRSINSHFPDLKPFTKNKILRICCFAAGEKPACCLNYLKIAPPISLKKYSILFARRKFINFKNLTACKKFTANLTPAPHTAEPTAAHVRCNPRPAY